MFGPRLVPDDTTIRFMKGRFAGLIVSAILSIGSLILAFYPGLNYGIDFRGGIAIVAHMPNGVDFQTLRSQLGELNLGPVELQEFGSPLDIQISVQRQPGDDSVQQNAAAAVRELLLRRLSGHHDAKRGCRRRDRQHRAFSRRPCRSRHRACLLCLATSGFDSSGSSASPQP